MSCKYITVDMVIVEVEFFMGTSGGWKGKEFSYFTPIVLSRQTVNSMSTFDAFREYVESWSKLTDEGNVILSTIDRKDVGKTQQAMTAVIEKLKVILEKMYDEYDKADESKMNMLRNCLEMYDQEYMVKESIQTIVNEPGFYTQHHQTGLTALWTAEAYIDKDFLSFLNI
ncbi:hypothetical protein BDA99DRAFT_524305 [Phascolomyces articulosus]|uniref:Uncharacterized protein n=1 Tax=Phascolomyces articulosus TaxID=60185 RepID=A0AAD5P8Y1_9FUNG|nr:hypothetical protein BDA99DRAFT_524305 [Phascolomyces articulosus]